MMRPHAIRRATMLATVVLVATSCGGRASDPSPSGDSSSTAMSAAALTPSLDGSFEVGADRRRLRATCWGTGTPAVLFDAGSGDAGIARWTDSPITRALAATSMICAYDRSGIGGSGEAPPHPRTLNEVVDDLHQLITAMDMPRPLVMVGSSGGGFNVYHYAGKYPEEVAGLILLDVPAGNPNLPPEDVPAWDSPDNPEHVDYVAVERQVALARLPLPAIPVTVVTASAGQSSDPAEQKVWLEGSSRPRQTVLSGGHDIQYADPDGVLAAVQDVLGAVGRP